MTEPLLGGIEAGGTKFMCAVGFASGELIHEARIPTRGPRETMADVISFFRLHGDKYAGFGIGSLGPIDLRLDSPGYGVLKPEALTGWGNFDIVGSVRRAFDVPIGLDTDVNVAALGEARWGGGRDLKNLLYITVGTGIGGGAIAEGSLLHGLTHPEMGHMRIPRDPNWDPFPGRCPYHGDCLEGLAAGPAIEARWGAPPTELPTDHSAWSLEAEYLAIACMNWICTLSPAKIIMGGGVMQPHLFPLVRDRARSLLNGYFDSPEIVNLESLIVPPALGHRAGVRGALHLASLAVH